MSYVLITWVDGWNKTSRDPLWIVMKYPVIDLAKKKKKLNLLNILGKIEGWSKLF